MFKVGSRKSNGLSLFVTLVGLSVVFSWHFTFNVNTRELKLSEVQYEETTQSSQNFSDKVVIGIVTCGMGKRRTVYNDHTAVLIKSVMISAEIYGVPEVEFHHFLEYPEEEGIFRKHLQDMGYPSNADEDENESQLGIVKVKLNTYSIKDVKIPKEFEKLMINHSRFRCGYVRFYFPSALPQVDSILYMDTDTLVTGNLMDIWNQFSKINRNDRNMFGAVNDMEPENSKFPEKTEWSVGEIPHLTKHGFNSGVLWMNLTRMREFGVEERVARIYQDYSKIVREMVDQRMFNILVFHNPDLISILPCQFNFGPATCERGLFCKGAQDDPVGIQLVHGNDHTFYPRRSLHGIYKHFREFHFSATNFSIESVRKDLMKPLRKWYDSSNPNHAATIGTGKCKGSLSKILFPNQFTYYR